VAHRARSHATNNRLLKTRTWERGTVTTYGYNAAGDLTSIDYSDSTPDVAHTYYRNDLLFG